MKPKEWLKSGCLTALWIVATLSGAVAVWAILRAVNSHNVFYGVYFPAGKASFADTTISYDPVIYFEGDRPNVDYPFNNPSTALGTPNSSSLQNLLPTLSERDDVALGVGGSITLKFTDNLLTGSSDESPDLWIFEAGGVTEAVFVEISKDGKTWHSVGKTSRDKSGIDIDGYGWKPQDFFAYVRLTDDPNEGDYEGVWENGRWLGWAGANIDAVGAISSASLEQPLSFKQPFPTTLSLPWVPPPSLLVAIATFILGLVTGYLLNRANKPK